MAGKTVGGWMDVTSDVRNEIVFEGKNKEYGAYYVRKKYTRVMLIAMAIAIASMVIGISIPLLLKVFKSKKANDVVTIKVDLKAPPPPDKNLPPPPPPPPPPPKPLINQLKVTPPVIAKINVDTTIATVKQVQVTNAGATNQKGKDTMIIAPIQAPAALGDDADKVFMVVQQQPKFPGDINKWLADHIDYPEQAKDANIQGTVFVSFIVEKDGSVSAVKILRSVNSYLDNEALNVIKKMPKWTAGQQNGHAVRVSYNVPIRFVLR
ncbi:MAG TPA: energy transducer TonB [Bacteroidia bacterium]|jgi:protein TonB|nr:energy transducer TonB [Bacteroidia bacterium]